MVQTNNPLTLFAYTSSQCASAPLSWNLDLLDYRIEDKNHGYPLIPQIIVQTNTLGIVTPAYRQAGIPARG